jgi:hypothetical protein
MKKHLLIGLGLALSIIAPSFNRTASAGGWTSTVHISQIQHSTYGGTSTYSLSLVTDQSPMTNPDCCGSCSYNPTAYQFYDSGTGGPDYKQMLALLTAAYLYQKPVQLYLDSCLNTYYPKVTQISLQ